MSMILSAFEKAMSSKTTYTTNGALSLLTPDNSGVCDGRISLFFKTVRGITDEQLHEYLEKSLTEDIVDTFVLTFNCRDPRGGKGERDIGRKMLKFLFQRRTEEFRKIFHLIPEYGRWDDLLIFFPIAFVGENEIQKKVQNEVVTFFCSKLVEDKNLMENAKPISICVKWAPTEGDSDDRKFKLVDTICSKMGIDKRTYRKEYTSPLRSYINIVEKYMTTNKWDEIEYSKVPSNAMKKLKKAFEKHSPELFKAWKNSLSNGEVKVNAKVLYPYEIIRELRTKGYADEVAEGQWKVLEQEIEKLGTLEDTCIVCDTSSSMHDPNFLPFDNSIALGMIVSKMVKGKFNGNVITFNDEPEFIKIDHTEPLYDRFVKVKNIPWGGSTNLQATFDLILEKAEEFDLPEDEMPKKLLIVSDMQFNNIEGYSNNKTNYEVIVEKYANTKYKTPPQIVFWNVTGESKDFPVSVADNGTCLISGFSPAILKSVINAKNFNSYGILREELDSDRYKSVRNSLV